jgi:hypothetical protein
LASCQGFEIEPCRPPFGCVGIGREAEQEQRLSLNSKQDSLTSWFRRGRWWGLRNLKLSTGKKEAKESWLLSHRKEG